MIKTVRILTFLFAAVIIIFSIFYIDPEIELTQAELAYRNGDMDQALRKARRANRVFSKDEQKANAYYLLARAAAKMDWTKKSKDYLDQQLDLTPGHINGLLLRGEVLHQLGDYQLALTDLNQGLQLARGNISEKALAYSLSKRGLTYLKLQKPELAENDAKEALGLTNKLPEAYQLLSRVMEEKGDFTKALQACEKAYQLAVEKDRLSVLTPEGQLLSERLVNLRVKVLRSK